MQAVHTSRPLALQARHAVLSRGGSQATGRRAAGVGAFRMTLGCLKFQCTQQPYAASSRSAARGAPSRLWAPPVLQRASAQRVPLTVGAASCQSACRRKASLAGGRRVACAAAPPERTRAVDGEAPPAPAPAPPPSAAASLHGAEQPQHGVNAARASRDEQEAQLKLITSDLPVREQRFEWLAFWVGAAVAFGAGVWCVPHHALLLLPCFLHRTTPNLLLLLLMLPHGCSAMALRGPACCFESFSGCHAYTPSTHPLH